MDQEDKYLHHLATRPHIYIHTNIHTYMHMYIHTYIKHKHIHAYVCTYIRTYIHTYIYTHTECWLLIHSCILAGHIYAHITREQQTQPKTAHSILLVPGHDSRSPEQPGITGYPKQLKPQNEFLTSCYRSSKHREAV